jgi:PPOX class probable F420-dependent enzyme
MSELTDDAREFLDRKVFAHVATLMPDGAPQVSPVWIDHEDSHVLFNTAEGRYKTENLEKDGRIAISIVDPDNPYRHMLIRGRVAELTREGADDHADAMAKKYLDQDTYPFRQPGEVRVKVLIEPESLTIHG